MSLRVIKHTKDPIETLEKMLNKTTLTTQRLSHYQIIGKCLHYLIFTIYFTL